VISSSSRFPRSFRIESSPSSERREKARLDKELEKDRELGVDGESCDNIIATADKDADSPANFVKVVEAKMT
jgi:hypothetical protein